jgi:hypothetical protein
MNELEHERLDVDNAAIESLVLADAIAATSILDACRVLSLTPEPSSQAGHAVLLRIDGEEIGLGLGLRLGLDLSHHRAVAASVPC